MLSFFFVISFCIKIAAQNFRFWAKMFGKSTEKFYFCT